MRSTTEPRSRPPGASWVRVPLVCWALLLALVGCSSSSELPARPPDYQLRVAEQAGGKVVSEPGGISCGQVCSARYRRGAVITLRVELDPGVEFAGWRGACSGSSLCILSLSADAEVEARFVIAGTSRPVPESMRRASDLDDDGVPDSQDACPVEEGPTQNNGCPSGS